jgi:hypothetical protein
MDDRVGVGAERLNLLDVRQLRSFPLQQRLPSLHGCRRLVCTTMLK